MSKRSSVIITIILVIVLGLTGGVLFLNQYYLPHVIKNKIITQLSKITLGEVKLEDIHFNLLHGLIIHGLILYDKDNPQKELCSVKEASASILLLPSFKAKKIIIPSLTIKSIFVRLIRQKDGSFNISYLFDRNSQSTASNDFVFIKNATITDSCLSFTDNFFEDPIAIDINDININTNIAIAQAALTGSFNFTKDTKKTNIAVQAQYGFLSKDLKGSLTLDDIDVNAYQPYLKSLNFQLTSAHLSQMQCDYQMLNKDIQVKTEFAIEALSLQKDTFFIKDAQLNAITTARTARDDLKHITYQGETTITKGSVSIKEKTSVSADIASMKASFSGDEVMLKVSADIKADNATLEKDDVAVSDGTALIQTQITIPLTPDKKEELSYQGTALINAKKISGVPEVETITDVATQCSFINRDITINDFTAHILDSSIEAKGTLKDNVLAIDAKGSFTLDELARFVPKDTGLAPYTISGTGSASVHIGLDFNTKEKPAISGKADLADIQISHNKNDFAIASPAGKIYFDSTQQQLKCLFEKINYLDKTYYLDATLTGFSPLLVNADIRDENTTLSLQATKSGDTIEISSLKGKFIDSDINLKGTIDLQSNMSLSGNIVLELKDLKDIIPNRKISEKMNPEGKLLIVAEISGPPKNWRLWNVKASAKCRTLNIYNLNMNNLDLSYSQIEKDGFLNNLSFNAYAGTGLIQGRLDFSNPETFYNFRGTIQEMDINLLKNDTPWKDKVFYGIFSSLFSVRGTGFDLSTINGEGNILLDNGNIWEFNPLKGLGNFMFSPGFSTISFTHAHGDFSIADSRIITNNLELLGSDLGLLIEGNISFKGDLDLLVNTQLAPSGKLVKNKGVKKIEGMANAVVGGVTSLKIGGTVEKPTYKLQSIEKTLIKSVGNIISNIFQ
ncbi:MAG: DUF748 domain-containing protein [Candidatus Omnitrophota bacterium]